jgi:hypothetical protein
VSGASAMQLKVSYGCGSLLNNQTMQKSGTLLLTVDAIMTINIKVLFYLSYKLNV